MFRNKLHEESQEQESTNTVNLDEDWHRVLRTTEGVSVIANVLMIMGHGEPSWRPDIGIYRTTALKDMAEHLLHHVETLDSGYVDAILKQIRLYRSE